MAEKRPDPQEEARRKARYRFEYQDRQPVNPSILLGLGVACVAGALVSFNALRQPKLPQVSRPTQSATRPFAAPPQVMLAHEPVRVSLPPVRPPASDRNESRIAAGAAPILPPAPPPAAPMAETPAAAPQPNLALAATGAALPSSADSRPVATIAAPPPAASPTDSCAALRSAVEQLVCSDPALRAAERRVEAAYRNAMQKTDNPRKVQRDHERWLAQRPALGGNRAAVMAHYDRRYDELTPVPMRWGPRLPPIVKPKSGSASL